jgi:hypothetical protein
MSSFTVDAAAEQPDSLIRMAYVAGFAMSNYSSTVGRLAKCVLRPQGILVLKEHYVTVQLILPIYPGPSTHFWVKLLSTSIRIKSFVTFRSKLAIIL